MPRVVPVDYDPFPKAAPQMEAVDYDPFAKTDVTQTPTEQQLAPASGAFPAVSGVAATPPQSSTPVSAPPPSDTPTAQADPGLLTEMGSELKRGLHSANRGRYLVQFASGSRPAALEDFLTAVEQTPTIEAQNPVGPSVKKGQEELATLTDAGVNGFLPALGVYAKNPRLALGTFLESAPSMIPSLATVPLGAAAGAIAGSAPGAALGAKIGAGAGSALGDFGSAFEDFARENYKPQTREDWRAIMLDPEKYDAALKYAMIHSGTVGLVDALGMHVGSRVGGKIVGDRITNPVGKVIATGVAGAPASSAVGAFGEAAGEYLGAGKVDPTQVAGEFVGGLVGDIATTAVEPAIHQMNVGGARSTPATPADAAALGAAMNTPTADQVSGSMSVRGDTPAFFSPLTRYIEEKGPGSATTDQWLGTLKNAPGVKQEEIADTGLDNFIAERQGKITKREILDHLNENAIQIQETVRTGGGQNVPGQNWITDPYAAAKYEGYTLPGERQGYTELTMHMPTRNIPNHELPAARQIRALIPEIGEGIETWSANDLRRRGVPQELLRQYTQEATQNNQQRDFVGGHYPEPNTIVHARVTDRTAPDGTPFALIEEIQSDWHQAGRKRGYVGQPHTDPTFMNMIDERIGQHIDNNVKDSRDPLYRAFLVGEGDSLVEAVRAGVITQDEATRYARDMKGTDPVPAGPFKQSWDELAFKRLLRWTADKGYRRVAWVNAAEQMRRYPGGVTAEKRDQGMQAFYDRIVPSIAKKWAKRLGGTIGETRLAGPGKYKVDIIGSDQRADGSTFTVYALRDPDGNLIQSGWDRAALDRLAATTNQQMALGPQVVQHIDLPQAAVDLIQRGLPMYSRREETRRGGATIDELAGNPIVNNFGRELATAFDALIKQFKLPIQVKLVFHDGVITTSEPLTVARGTQQSFPGALGMAEVWGPTSGQPATIHINPKLHKNAAEVWATMTHELGHIVEKYLFATAPANVQTAVAAAFGEWRANRPMNENMRKLIQARDNAVIAYYNTRNFTEDRTLNQMGSPEERQYWMEFEEWFAEQVARWATSAEKPLSTVEKFFKQLATTLKEIFAAAANKFGLSFEPSKAMADWLDSFHKSQPFAQDIITTANVETTADNGKHMGPEEKPVERQPETIAPREAIDKLFEGRPPKEAQVAAAYADKFNKIYKWMLGIHQVAQRNAHIVPLQEYTETIAVAQLVKQQIMIRAQEVLKKWNKLGGRQGDAVAAMLDEIQRMEYRTPQEVANKVARLPTQAEIQAIGQKHGVTQEGYAVAKEIAATFQEHLTRYEAMLRAEAMKIADILKRTQKLAAIAKHMTDLRSKPYFPAMRFGDYTITVRDAAGHVIHFETFERERTRNHAADAIRQQYGVSKDQMNLGKLDREVKPLMGVPTQLLDLMGEKLNLTRKQRDMLDQLKFELSPAQSFKHRFQHKRRIAGYSQDFRRAYANYFFHGANHLMKTMYADRLRDLAKATKLETKGKYDTTTRDEIVAYMNDHLENWLDPKSDWAAIRSIAFLWSLAWTPAAAAQNLTQTLMTTYPFLAQQFGDFKAVAAITKTGLNFQNFYRKGTLENATDFKLRAIGRGIQDGIINEAMAPELAGFAEGRTLGIGFGGNELQRGIHTFNTWGAKMFELAEQVNRRLVFRATLDLATENPGSKYVTDMRVKHKLHYDQLRAEGWTEAEASAYVAARDATITTQFQYGREYAPRFMRGKIRSVFVFKTFIQNYCVFLANYPQAAVRSMLIMGFLGGLMAVPGGDDLKEILKAIGWQMFGKDFDIEQEARRMVIQLLGDDEYGRNAGDMVLHGVARKGYGIPAVMDMLGGTVGVDIPMPVFDRSKAISAGTLLPLELGKIFGPPTLTQDAIISAQAQKASGAVFGAGFNVYKALTNAKVSWGDSKRWERAVPRAIGSLAKAYRVGTEGRERNSAGATVVNYDVRDTQQLAEVIGMAAGYSPYRQSLQWDRIMAGQEATKLWDIRRQVLMKQMGNAVLGKDQKEIDRVRGAIQNFNKDLPVEARAKAISGDTLRQSVGSQARSRQAQEAEVSVKKSDIPILREVQKLYPASQATAVRRVPRSLQ